MLDVTAAGTGSPNCAGGNVSPPFAWSGAPPETKSFAFLMADVDGRAGLGVSHLVVYGIPATTTGVASGALGTPTGMVAGRNTRGGGGYLGPCPAPGTGAHHYVFQVIATDLPPDALAPGLSRDALLAALDGHAKAGASLVGLFGGARRD